VSPATIQWLCEPHYENIASHLIGSDSASFAALRLVSRGWKRAADQATRLLTIRVHAEALDEELPAAAAALRSYSYPGRFYKAEALYVCQWGGADMRPSMTHELAAGRTANAHGWHLVVPGMVWSDMLEISMRAVSRESASLQVRDVVHYLWSDLHLSLPLIPPDP